MLTHGQIWSALDRIAGEHGLSVSALAKKAGLDATSFNRSKRVTADGRPRWPSTESIAKVLAATGASVEDFFGLLDQSARHHGPGFAEDARGADGLRAIPHRRLPRAAEHGAFDEAGIPAGTGWDAIIFPDLPDENAYALEVAGDGMLPLYRDGDIVIVSPAASVRRGDRVMVKTAEGEVLAREMVRKTARMVELRGLDAAQEETQLALEQVIWMARIVWASQ